MNKTIDYETFRELVGANPRLKAMLEWRLSLGVLRSSDEVAEYFKEDWNAVEDLYVRVGNTYASELAALNTKPVEQEDV